MRGKSCLLIRSVVGINVLLVKKFDQWDGDFETRMGYCREINDLSVDSSCHQVVSSVSILRPGIHSKWTF
jgi:hypothetical protein